MCLKSYKGGQWNGLLLNIGLVTAITVRLIQSQCHHCLRCSNPTWKCNGNTNLSQSHLKISSFYPIKRFMSLLTHHYVYICLSPTLYGFPLQEECIFILQRKSNDSFQISKRFCIKNHCTPVEMQWPGRPQMDILQEPFFLFISF